MNLSGYPYAELSIAKDGRLVTPAEVDAVLDAASAPAITDLLVLAHGWNNDMDDARGLYRSLAARLAGTSSAVSGMSGRRLALIGVLWPSKKFAEADLIPGGAAALAAGPTDALLTETVDDLGALLGSPDGDGLAEARAAVPDLDSAETAQRAFVDGVRRALKAEVGGADQPGDEDTPGELFTLDGAELLDLLARPAFLNPPRPGGGGAARVGDGPASGGAAGGGAGGAAGLAILGGIRNAARNLLNFATYYTMKNRAGVVGFTGVAPVLQKVHARRPDLRVHLAGHSFGGRVAAAAATARDSDPVIPIASLTLMQAAFSHYGFAANWEPGRNGLFRGAFAGRRVVGPTLITHTANDKAVGIAYALASRVAGQVAAGVGDAGDKFGGIGRNGAQRTPEAVQARLLDVGGTYQLTPGKAHNLLADTFIASHSAVTGPQVAYALLTAISAG
jgi:hypothetical protein